MQLINYSISNPLVSVYFEGVDEKPQIIPQKSLTSFVYTHIEPERNISLRSCLGNKQYRRVSCHSPCACSPEAERIGHACLFRQPKCHSLGEKETVSHQT